MPLAPPVTIAFFPCSFISPLIRIARLSNPLVI
jgi:hypothetical protein